MPNPFFLGQIVVLQGVAWRRVSGGQSPGWCQGLCPLVSIVGDYDVPFVDVVLVGLHARDLNLQLDNVVKGHLVPILCRNHHFDVPVSKHREDVRNWKVNWTFSIPVGLFMKYYCCL